MTEITEVMKPEFDGGRFDARRWCVSGLGSFWFTSKEDAQAAIDLAAAVGQAERRRVCQEIRDKLPD